MRRKSPATASGSSRSWRQVIRGAPPLGLEDPVALPVGLERRRGNATKSSSKSLTVIPTGAFSTNSSRNVAAPRARRLWDKPVKEHQRRRPVVPLAQGSSPYESRLTV